MELVEFDLISSHMPEIFLVTTLSLLVLIVISVYRAFKGRRLRKKLRRILEQNRLHHH